MHIISSNLLKNEVISKSSQKRQLQQHITNHSGISARSTIKSRNIFPLFEISVDVHTLAKTNMTSFSNRKQQIKLLNVSVVLRFYDKHNLPYHDFHRYPLRAMYIECHLLSIVRPKYIKMEKTRDTGKKTTKLP